MQIQQAQTSDRITLYPVESGKVMRGKPIATFHIHQWQTREMAHAMADAFEMAHAMADAFIAQLDNR